MIRQIVVGFVCPVAAGIAVLIVAARVARRPHRERAGQVGLGVAIAVCVIAGFIAAEGLPLWPPAARWHWLPLLTAAAAAMGVVASMAPKSLAMLAVCAAATGSLAAWKIRLPGVDAIAWRAGLGLTVFVATILLGRLIHLPPSVGLSLDLAAVFAGMAALFVAVHFTKMAVISGCVATVLGAAAVVGRFERRAAPGATVVVVLGTLLPTCALIGYSYDYGNVGVLSWSLLAASPGAMCVASMLTREWNGRVVQWLTRRAAVIVFCAVAIALADFSDDLNY